MLKFPRLFVLVCLYIRFHITMCLCFMVAASHGKFWLLPPPLRVSLLLSLPSLPTIKIFILSLEVTLNFYLFLYIFWRKYEMFWNIFISTWWRHQNQTNSGAYQTNRYMYQTSSSQAQGLGLIIYQQINPKKDNDSGWIIHQPPDSKIVQEAIADVLVDKLGELLNFWQTSWLTGWLTGPDCKLLGV